MIDITNEYVQKKHRIMQLLEQRIFASHPLPYKK